MKGVVPDLILPDLNDAYEVGEAYQKYALPHDVIRASDRLKRWDRQALHLEKLREASAERIKGEQYFQYLRSDIERAKAEIAKNELSLNLETRLKQLEKEEDQRKSRNAERRKRFAEVEEDDKESFRIFRLSLDDLKRAELVPFGLGDASEDHVREVVDEVAELEKNLKWPSGVDMVKREGLAVLRDLIAAKTAASLALIEKGKE